VDEVVLIMGTSVLAAGSVLKALEHPQQSVILRGVLETGHVSSPTPHTTLTHYNLNFF